MDIGKLFIGGIAVVGGIWFLDTLLMASAPQTTAPERETYDQYARRVYGHKWKKYRGLEYNVWHCDGDPKSKIPWCAATVLHRPKNILARGRSKEDAEQSLKTKIDKRFARGRLT